MKSRSSQAKTLALCSLFILAMAPCLYAHPIQGELDKLSKSAAVWIYLQLGFLHILPFGFDHILFILGLLLLSPKLKTILWQATAFTVAHSITLALAMYHVVTPPTAIIEPLISLSILYVALENIVSPKLRPARIGVVFLFGLIHGLGFAGALVQLGLPKHAYLLSLLAFNLGVELGQATVILLAWFILIRWLAQKPSYRKTIVIPFSIFIALIAAVWTIQRIALALI